MYYCNGCGVLRYLSRPENKDRPTGPMEILFCNFCQAETNYRKCLPEYFDAANDKGVEAMLRGLYKKLTTPMSESDGIQLDFLEKDDEVEEI